MTPSTFDPAETRARLWQLLGDIPAPMTPQVELLSRRAEPTYALEHFRFVNGLGDAVYGYLLLPRDIDYPAPAVLYHHEHGGKYSLGKDAALRIRENGYAPGIALAEAGFVVCAIDAYGFGRREHEGPGGKSETGRETETSLFKQFLWQGRTLWGMMLHDDRCALAYLRSRSEVDASRIGTAGMSLGGSRSTWLAALDESVKAVAPISQMTRYADFAAQGEYRRHAIYYYVPGMLASGLDMEHIVACTAPRSQLILTGDSDPLSPLSGIHAIMDYARAVYADFGAADKLDLTLYEGVGHAYLPDMLRRMLAFFSRVL
ncbi:MAG: dienelactone hydrolase family protein [Chloroflexi bacterium]|nr:dienelactone hydrolase family protein [Chloroflexota bacterium]